MATDSQLEDLREWHFRGIAEQACIELAKAADLIAKFTGFAAARGVALNSDSFEYVQTIGILAKEPGIAAKLLGPISAERDGLLSFKEIAHRLPPSQIQAGYFMGSDFILMAHSCYRRQMYPNNNWAPRFIDLLWEFDDPNVEKYIAIDEDRVRINVDGSSYHEADHWYGAPFDEDIRKIKSGAVKLRPPLDLESSYVGFLFADAYCLDIKWSESNGIKTFQALEMKTHDIQIEIDSRNYFPARYLHAEFDISANCFRHFDGAIQYFLEDEYLQRRDSDFNMTTKNSSHVKARSKKVFKLNGPLSADNWVELCCHFYAANPLTFEYFTGTYPEHVINVLTKLQARNTQRENDA
jgi:hypothetical protein